MESRNLLYLDNLPKTLSIHVKAGEKVSLELASFENPVDSTIVVDVEKDGAFVGAFADFAKKETVFDIRVNLLEEGANCEWHLASMSGDDAKKKYLTNASHVASHTTALISNYGIARDRSFLSFSGASEILHGSKGANTRQEAKIIVFDPESDGLASPILKIDENDVLASHAAVVGRLNEQHLFYLESRGLPLESAKRLIALGYLKPIERYFVDENIRGRLDTTIEEGF